MNVIVSLRGRWRKMVFKWLRFKAIRIYGNHLAHSVLLSRSTILDKQNPKGVYIDEYTYLAGGVIVLAHDMCRSLNVNTKIGKQCFIGANAIIMPGVEIGDEVIVGSGSVVTKNIPSNTIVAGNPAKIIRTNIHTKKYGILIQ